MEKTPGVAPKQVSCRCCTGLTMFTKAQQEAGKSPSCYGIRARKDGDVVVDGAQELSASNADFRYFCLGFSVYPDASTSTSADPDGARLLPYCEGWELAVLEEGSAADGADAATGRQPPLRRRLPGAPQDPAALPPTIATTYTTRPPAGGSTSGAASPAAPSESRLITNLRKNAEKVYGALRGDEVPSLVKQLGSLQEAEQRWLQVAQANVGKLQSAASRVGRTMYAVTFGRGQDSD